MSTAFVFDPDASYGKVEQIRQASVMPVAGLRFVASVTGRWKIVEVVEFGGLEELPDRVDSLSGSRGGDPDDPETAIVIGGAKVRRSEYRANTALVRMDVRVDDPNSLLEEIAEAIGSDEADVVMGDFDILACVVDDNEETLNQKIFDLRKIGGVKRTVSLRVIDYVSTSEHADDDHRVDPA